MRIPEPRPPGLTLFFAIVLAIVCASFVNKSFGGLVETRLYVADPFFRFSHRTSPVLRELPRPLLWVPPGGSRTCLERHTRNAFYPRRARARAALRAAAERPLRPLVRAARRVEAERSVRVRFRAAERA
jgi:hypothetical protein